ncbi:MAG: cation transporter [Anaerococcus sp.]|nr:cation transporter [Anaerococcus sp.]
MINLILVIFKLIVGFSTNSSAIVNDGFNNLSDTIVSIMAIAVKFV